MRITDKYYYGRIILALSSLALFTYYLVTHPKVLAVLAMPGRP